LSRKTGRQEVTLVSLYFFWYYKLSQMEPTKTHIFPNGLAAVYLQLPSTKVFTVILLVGVGSRFETLENKGLARFYANFCLQGSEQFQTKNELEAAMDQLGLTIRPAVYPEYSLYYFSCTKEKLVPSFELFSSIFFRPALTADGMSQEKELSLSELEISDKNPQFSSISKLNLGMFNNHPIGFDILGVKETVENFTPEVAQDFKNKYYVSQNCLLFISGPDPDFSFSSLDRAVGLVASGQRQKPIPFDFSQTKIVQEKVSQMGRASILTFGFPCYGRDSEKRIGQSLLLNILYENHTNKRLKTLRDKKLVTGIKPWIRICSECGLFLIQASCLSTKEKEVQDEIMAQLTQLSTGSITAEELAIAKSFYGNRFLEKLSNSLELGFFYSMVYFFNVAEQTPEQIMEKVNKTSLEEINQLCQQIIRPDMISWVIVGPGY